MAQETGQTDVRDARILRQAEDHFPDRRVFTLDSQSWDAFVAALDATPKRHARLERPFRGPSVFDPK